MKQVKDDDFIAVPYVSPIRLTYSEPKIEVKSPADQIRNKPYPNRGDPADLNVHIEPLSADVAEMSKKILSDQEKFVITAIQDVGINIDKDGLVQALNGDRARYEEAYRAGIRSGKRWMTAAQRYIAEHKNCIIMANPPTWCEDCPLTAEARKKAHCLMADKEPGNTDLRIDEYCPIRSVADIWEFAEAEWNAEGIRDDAGEATRGAGENHRADALRYLTMTGGDQE